MRLPSARHPAPTAFRSSVGLTAILALAATLGSSTASAEVTFVQQLRDVSTFATLDRAEGEDPFCNENVIFEDVGVFDERRECLIGEEGNQAYSTAAQLSYLTPTLYTAEGSFEAYSEIGDESNFAEAFGGTRVFSDFSVDETTELHLRAEIRAAGNGTVNVVFRVNNGEIYLYRSLFDATESIDEVYTLAPGTYELNLVVGGFGQALPGGGGEPASGSFVASLQFPVSADVGPASSLSQERALPGVMPNPVRGAARIVPAAGTQSIPGDLEILDLSGRAVRRLYRVPAGGTSWNATDDAGRPLPSGVYVVRDSEGRSSKVTVLP